MLTVFLVAAAAQLFFWGMFSRYGFPAAERGPAEGAGPCPPVSVVVCFRNEEAVLQNCLFAVLEQQYPGDFEVIAVDDNSTDNSAAIVQKLVAEVGDQLRLLQPGPTRPGKKDALTFGINHARYDHILLTDADCLPLSHRWLALMTRPLRRGAEVVLGVGEYAKNGNCLVDRFQRFEAIYVSLKYLSFARLGLPYMGVGRNLAYRRSFFQRAGGFVTHAELPGGDDDLLVSNNARAAATACVSHPQARTLSRLSGSWRVFLRQRRRHQSVGFRYRPAHQITLGLVALSHGLFFLLGFFLLFSAWWKLALLIYALRLLLVYGAFRKSGFLGAGPDRVRGRRRAGAKEVFKNTAPAAWTLPLFDAALAPWYLYLAVVGLLPARRWA